MRSLSSALLDCYSLSNSNAILFPKPKNYSLHLTCGGPKVSALDSGSSSRGFEPWPGVLCCVLGCGASYPPRCINGNRWECESNKRILTVVCLLLPKKI